jgi:hypothetical protein
MVYKRPYGAPHDPESLPYRNGLKKSPLPRAANLYSGSIMMPRLLVLTLNCACAVTGLAQSPTAKIIDVRPYSSAGPSIIAPNNGYPVVIPTSRNMFSLTVALDDMLYSVEVRQTHHVKPSNFIVGDSIQAHLEGEKLVVVDPSGKQIKEKVVRRERLPAKP